MINYIVTPAFRPVYLCTVLLDTEYFSTTVILDIIAKYSVSMNQDEWRHQEFGIFDMDNLFLEPIDSNEWFRHSNPEVSGNECVVVMG